MNLLLMQGNKFQGMPRSGLQMVIDPYKDCYGRNILPVGREKFVNWIAYDSAVITLTQNQTVVEWETDEATRITATAGNGTSLIKYYASAGIISIIGNTYPVACYVKNVGTNSVTISNSISYQSATLLPNETRKILLNAPSSLVGAVHIDLLANVPTNGFDIIAWQPQINLGQLYPYALPSGLPSNPLNYYKNSVVQNGSSLGADSNEVSFTGLSYKMNTSTNADNYLLIPKGGEYDNQSTFTCTFILNALASGGGGYARLFDKSGTSAVLKGILAYIDSNGKINFSRYNGSGNYKTWVTTNAIAWGTTYIVTIKANRSLTDDAVEIFVNGVRQTITTIVFGTPALADDSTNDLILGNRISLDRYFLGDFYTVNWTSKLLSDSEIFGLTKYLKAYWLNKGVTI